MDPILVSAVLVCTPCLKFSKFKIFCSDLFFWITNCNIANCLWNHVLIFWCWGEVRVFLSGSSFGIHKKQMSVWFVALIRFRSLDLHSISPEGNACRECCVKQAPLLNICWEHCLPYCVQTGSHTKLWMPCGLAPPNLFYAGYISAANRLCLKFFWFS